MDDLAIITKKMMWEKRNGKVSIQSYSCTYHVTHGTKHNTFVWRLLPGSEYAIQVCSKQAELELWLMQSEARLAGSGTRASKQADRGK